MLRVLPHPWDFKNMSTARGQGDLAGDCRDKYEPIRRLSMVKLHPPRNPNKPLTSFGIKDILSQNGRLHRAVNGNQVKNLNHLNNLNNQRNLQLLPTTRIVRPWDSSPSPRNYSEHSSDADDEEINVDDDEDVPASPRANLKDGISPLDALMAMANKTFKGLETSEAAEAKRREQATLFGKHQTPKKRRKSRTAFTNQQIYELEKRFLYQKYLTPADRDEIAQHLGLTNAQVITWFQNRRAKLKRDLEELKNDVVATRKVSSGEPSDAEFDSDSMEPSPPKRGKSPQETSMPELHRRLDEIRNSDNHVDVNLTSQNGIDVNGHSRDSAQMQT